MNSGTKSPSKFNSPKLDRLLRRVRRRLIWKARLSRLLLCAAAASAAAVVLSLILLAIGRPGVIAPAAVLLAGWLLGLAYAGQVRLSRHAAAAWADERAGLDDLLATAVAIRHAATCDAELAKAVVQIAEARAARINANELRVAIGGQRAWSAAALGAALALTLGMMSPPRDNTSGVTDRIDSSSAIEAHLAPQPAQLRPAGDVALNEPTDRPGPADLASDAPDQAQPGTAHSNDSKTAGESASAGGGLAVTSAPPPQVNDLAVNPAPPPIGIGNVAGGGTGISIGNSTGTSTGQSDAPTHAAAAPPWNSGATSSAQGAATQPSRNNRTDAAYQDLVRDYFQRP